MYREDLQLKTQKGCVIGLAEYGAADGIPVFFFHGWPCSRRQARLLHEPAQARGLRILAVDRPGIGGSSFDPERKLLDWPPLLEELAELLDIEKFAVLGVSGGGPYALACAYALPERLTATGIICGAPPLTIFDDRSDLHPAYHILRAVRLIAPWTMSPFLPLVRAVSCLPQKHLLIKVFMRTILKADRRALDKTDAYDAVALSFQDAAENGMRPLIVDGDVYYSHWGFDLENIQVPVQFWHGESDRNIPARMIKEIVEKIPHATGTWFPDDGHFSLPILRVGEILDAFVREAQAG
ncbi:MAG: pimeloyl-ACP methyl ester carboxylesterase [Verrucomicrobiales bacterium]|jgi:pimeloyl-ACP methyl ester carboxylesterase